MLKIHLRTKKINSIKKPVSNSFERKVKILAPVAPESTVTAVTKFHRYCLLTLLVLTPSVLVYYWPFLGVTAGLVVVLSLTWVKLKTYSIHDTNLCAKYAKGSFTEGSSKSEPIPFELEEKQLGAYLRLNKYRQKVKKTSLLVTVIVLAALFLTFQAVTFWVLGDHNFFFISLIMGGIILLSSFGVGVRTVFSCVDAFFKQVQKAGTRSINLQTGGALKEALEIVEPQLVNTSETSAQNSKRATDDQR